VFMDGGVKYSKIVHYIRQRTDEDVFSEWELNSILGHYSKNVKSLFRDFPDFSVVKLNSTIFFSLKWSE